jgi:hypothetical protein
MDRSRVAYLIAETNQQNEYGVFEATTSKKKVFVNVNSVGQSEWFEGGRNGLNPEYRMTMFAPDFDGERIIEFDGKQYAIYRTFVRDDEMIELYVERRKGDE